MGPAAFAAVSPRLVIRTEASVVASTKPPPPRAVEDRRRRWRWRTITTSKSWCTSRRPGHLTRTRRWVRLYAVPESTFFIFCQICPSRIFVFPNMPLGLVAVLSLYDIVFRLFVQGGKQVYHGKLQILLCVIDSLPLGWNYLLSLVFCLWFVTFDPIWLQKLEKLSIWFYPEWLFRWFTNKVFLFTRLPIRR